MLYKFKGISKKDEQIALGKAESEKDHGLAS